jgi:hypothetical protein
VLPASHRHLQSGYERPLSDDDGDILPAGFSAAQAEGEWRTAPSDMRAGDIILFNAKLIHAATPHAEQHFRLSLDTRMAALLPHSPPASEQPEAREEQKEEKKEEEGEDVDERMSDESDEHPASPANQDDQDAGGNR